RNVTGVQSCALPILDSVQLDTAQLDTAQLDTAQLDPVEGDRPQRAAGQRDSAHGTLPCDAALTVGVFGGMRPWARPDWIFTVDRSEERRVGKDAADA